MEMTRHFTATAFVVNAGMTILHEHPKLNLWLPPGGHLHRDELPHQAAVREVREETGLEIDLLAEATGPHSDTARPLPQPETIQLEDINIHEEGVGHQHIDFIYFATATSRTISPAPDETGVSQWEWVDATTLEEARFDPDVTQLGKMAIERANSR